MKLITSFIQILIMTYQEKKAILSIVSTLLIFGGYTFYVFVLNMEESLAKLNDSYFWGKFILVLIPVSIIAQIIITIIFTIINKMATDEDMPSFSDELDKLIELKSMRIGYVIFIFGFLAAMTTQVLHMELYTMFVALISSGFIASVVDELAKLYYYRQGV